MSSRSPDTALNYAAIVAALAPTGIAVRGGCQWQGQWVILLGQTGGGLWPHFAANRRAEPDPLDAWSKRVVTPIAKSLGARAVFPSDQPYQPFQAWALAAEALHPSPLGLLIHPVHGLWHAYRAALLLDGAVTGVPDRADTASPCETCAAKPCLSACPVGAFSGAGYDVQACAGHLASGDAPVCRGLGCRARDACPIGEAYRYPQDQIAFHMNAFAAARLGRGRAKPNDG